MDWFPWYFIIYKADTMHLNPYQDGCYRRLIDHYMETRQPLPDSDAALARIIGDSHANWVSMGSAIVRPFFTARHGKLHLKRCDNLLKKQDEGTKTLSESGKKGAEKRWGKNKDIDSHPMAGLSEGYSRGEEEEKKKRGSKKGSKKDSLSDFSKNDEFEKWFQNSFWEPYPKTRAGAKDKAMLAMKKALTKTTREEMENAVRRYASSDEVSRGFAKGAAAWLNDERWTNDYRPENGQHHNKKTSYLDKIQAAGVRASQILEEQMEADRDAPWNRVADRPDESTRLLLEGKRPLPT